MSIFKAQINADVGAKFLFSLLFDDFHYQNLQGIIIHYFFRSRIRLQTTILNLFLNLVKVKLIGRTAV